MYAFAIETALGAGRILLEKFGKKIGVSKKGEIDLVTEADLASEKYVINQIENRFPQHSILAEESGSTARAGDMAWKWIIDPLDGTTNYAHGYPCFCVTIALEHNGELVLGVSYDPTRDELFAAERRQGASLNNKRISVSERTALSDSLLVTGFPYDIKNRGNLARTFETFLMRSRAVRRDGSAAIDLAYVACGRFDGFWEEGLNPWDVAAGILMVREAGGTVTGYDGGEASIYRPPFVATNGAIHDEMLAVLNETNPAS
ncbi:MAG: inositol monophosphatase family protein [Pyrinomonadaceae bacterium]